MHRLHQGGTVMTDKVSEIQEKMRELIFKSNKNMTTVLDENVFYTIKHFLEEVQENIFTVAVTYSNDPHVRRFAKDRACEQTCDAMAKRFDDIYNDIDKLNSLMIEAKQLRSEIAKKVRHSMCSDYHPSLRSPLVEYSDSISEDN
jgi:cob(I)alamin adenosyltransferase